MQRKTKFGLIFHVVFVFSHHKYFPEINYNRATEPSIGHLYQNRLTIN